MSRSNALLSSAGALLLVAAAAKAVAAAGSAPALGLPDPILGVSARFLLFAVAGVETCVGAFCLVRRMVAVRAALVAWLSTDFVIYRVGLHLAGARKPCECFGHITDALGVPAGLANVISLCALFFLLLVSYGVLTMLYVQCARVTTSEARTHAPLAAHGRLPEH